ncbi:MAG: hypothetical protein DDT39_00640 [Firmicutes bacterium]|nr:hypothetical protein [candidate division NPL-UPA2 bacterium]MBT9153975.1 hypothetical protein [candidate division NPL-UPA2 bacterium]
MNTLLLLTACFVGTLSFALIFRAPPRSLFWCGLIGALGYGVLLILQNVGAGSAAAVFFAASVVGLASELLARASKIPATVYIIAGIIPLVPGAAAYFSMLYFAQGNYREALVALSSVAHMSIAISAGLAVGTVLRRK